MRLRFTLLAAALVALACMAVPSLASAAPHPVHNHSLTIHATPSVVNAGDPVLIYGQLKGRDSADQTIRLYHRINPATQFTLISVTKTDSQGKYEFTRAEGVVMSNRNWYVTGPVYSHSKTIHERVTANITLQSSATAGTTRHPIVFSGQVTPSHVGDFVYLQASNAAGTAWHTIARTRVGSGSNYQFSQGWRTPGARDVRVFLRADARNIASASNDVTVVINQTQIGDFTISTTTPIVGVGSPAAITGTLSEQNTTTPVAAGTAVGLYARTPGSDAWAEQQTTTTSTGGSYSFNVQSNTNELYQARTLSTPVYGSAVLFIGVQDSVSMSASTATATVGQQITFSGSVSPAKSGHVIYLQKLSKEGTWYTVETSQVSATSTFSFNWTFGTAGSKQFRARITGGPANVGGASSSVPVVVSQPPVNQLPMS